MKIRRYSRPKNILQKGILFFFVCLLAVSQPVSAKTSYEFRVLNDQLWYEEGCEPSSTPPAVAVSNQKKDENKTTKIIIPLFNSGDKAGALAAIEKYKFGGMAMTGDGKAFDKAFFDDAKAKSGGSFIPMADEEGGGVARYGIANKAASELGKMSTDDVKKEGQRVGEGLKNYGVEVDLAPVLDIEKPGLSNHLRQGMDGQSRAFGTDEKTVTEKAGAFAAGLSAGGVKPTYKHFPGLGQATAHTDFSPATLDYNNLGEDLKPFKSLANQNSGLVMLSNAMITGLGGGGDGLPAPTNPRLIEKLRGDIGFGGTIITDDLDAVSKWPGQPDLPTIAASSVKAGADLLILKWPGDAVMDKIIEKINGEDVPDERVNEAYGKYQSIASSSTATPSADSPSGNDACTCQNGAGQTVALEGKDNTEKILKFFMSKGLSLAQAAGIVGNMMQESGLNPAIIQGGGIADDNYTPQNGVGFGLVQWTFTPRQQPLVDMAKERGKKVKDLDVQLEYVWKELNGGYKKTLDTLKTTQDPVEAAVIVHGPPDPGYEASADSAEKVRTVRGGNAKKVYDQYKGGAVQQVSDTGGSAECGESSGTGIMSADCATLVAKMKEKIAAGKIVIPKERADPDLANCTTDQINCKPGVNPKLLRTLIALEENTGAGKLVLWNMNTGHDCDSGDHPKGHASDIPCDSSGGTETEKCKRIIDYLIANKGELDLRWVIWANYKCNNAGPGFIDCTTPGHGDHIHISHNIGTKT